MPSVTLWMSSDPVEGSDSPVVTDRDRLTAADDVEVSYSCALAEREVVGHNDGHSHVSGLANLIME
jgi:hypothetical protein